MISQHWFRQWLGARRPSGAVIRTQRKGHLSGYRDSAQPSVKTLNMIILSTNEFTFNCFLSLSADIIMTADGLPLEVPVLPEWYGPWFNTKMSSYWYRKPHCGDKTVVRSSCLHNGISYTGKITSLYWISPLAITPRWTRPSTCKHINNQGPFYWHGLILILAWISNNFSIKVWDEINYPIPNILQWLYRWSLRMEKHFHPKLNNGCNYSSMLGIKLTYVIVNGAPAHKRQAAYRDLSISYTV